MKKNRFIRISKRVMVLLLCCSLVSGACFNKYKVTANAAAMTATLGSCAAYEICLYIGGALLATCGLGAAYENRDQIAEVGKDFIDSMNLDEVSDWLLTKVNTAGQSYVFGSEALQEVQSMDFTVIQGGGNMPENNNDNDDDGDIDADDRTKELEQMGMWATTYLVEIMEDGVKPLIEGIRNGEENFISEVLGIQLNLFTDDELSLNENWADYNNVLFDGNIFPDSSGIYRYRLYIYKSATTSNGYNFRNFFTLDSSSLLAGYVQDGSLKLNILMAFKNYIKKDSETIWKENASGTSVGMAFDSYSCNFPVFSSQNAMNRYLETGNLSDCVNQVAKVYTIADWLQDNWTSALTQLNTGIRSLADNMLIVGEAANQALINQSNGLGYIEDLDNRIATTAPLSLPDSIADPEYYPADSSVPALAPEELPWNVPVVSPDSGQAPGTDSTPESGEDVVIGDYAIDLRKLFPFCIPFDFIELLRVLDAEPEAPRFEIPFVVPSVGIDEMYVIDLSMLDDVMEIIRLFELVGFVIGLMLLTGKVIKW